MQYNTKRLIKTRMDFGILNVKYCNSKSKHILEAIGMYYALTKHFNNAIIIKTY